MRWQRRKPLWPTVVTLGLVFVLALAASRSWQGLGSRHHAAASAEAGKAVPVPAGQLRRTGRIDSPSTTPTAPTSPAFVAPTSAPPQAVRKSAAPAVAESLPRRKQFDFDALVKVRDSLLAIIDQMPSVELTPVQPSVPPAAATEAKPQPTVRVSSTSDRLAMLQRRQPATSILVKTAQPNAVTKAQQEAANFAVILLEASRRRQTTPPKESKPNRATPFAHPGISSRANSLEPRLAMRATPRHTESPAPAPAFPAEPTEPPTLSQPAAAESVASRPVLSQPSVTKPEEPEPMAPPAIETSALSHRPQTLVQQLEDFLPGAPGASWSQQVLTQVNRLTTAGPDSKQAAHAAFGQLETLHEMGIQQAIDSENPSVINQWQQTAQALGRRLPLWRLLLDAEQPRIVNATSETTHVLPLLSEIAAILEQANNGEEWREYLLLDSIATATSEGISTPALTRAKLAQEVLSRMVDDRLTAAQRDFLATEQFTQLQQSLRPWAAGKVNLETLAALVERYELGRENRYAEVIAQLQQRLQWSSQPKLQELADHLDQHYRGANMRIAMSDDLMNRMMPKQEPIVSPVRDSIAGAKVRGRARTTTQLRVRLLPEAEAWRVSLEATGKVYSDTRSDTWPARIRNAAKMQYQGSKEILISQEGIQTAPARASAQGRNELIGVDSQLDPIPIVGQLLRDMARKKHKKSRPVALTQAKSKVTRQVKQRMDTALAEKIDGLEVKFRDKVLAPIEELALLAEPLDMHTTPERAVMQLRLANTGQLAAHTLRPLAPSDSVLSLQMHETALNNAMMGLGLDGRRMTMLELFEFLTERFGSSEATPPAELPGKAIIQFASHDSVRVQCEGDRLEVVLSVAELSHQRDKIKNFEIHVHFRPSLNGLSVRLIRDGSLQFSGRRLKTGPRVVLHSILGKVLQEDQAFTLVSPKLMLDPRFAGLMVTQLVIEDGWIGLALGPAHARRTAWRASAPDVFSTPFVR